MRERLFSSSKPRGSVPRKEWGEHTSTHFVLATKDRSRTSAEIRQDKEWWDRWRNRARLQTHGPAAPISVRKRK